MLSGATLSVDPVGLFSISSSCKKSDWVGSSASSAMVGISPQSLGPRSALVGLCLQKGVAVAVDETGGYVEGRENVRKREILLAYAYIVRVVR